MGIVLLARNASVLRNKLGLKDEVTLTAMERLHTKLQAEQIASDFIPIDRTSDAAHVKAKSFQGEATKLRTMLPGRLFE